MDRTIADLVPSKNNYMDPLSHFEKIVGNAPGIQYGCLSESLMMSAICGGSTKGLSFSKRRRADLRHVSVKSLHMVLGQ